MFKWLGVIAIGGILTIMGVQLIPVYIQNHMVSKVAQQVCLLYTSPSPRD